MSETNGLRRLGYATPAIFWITLVAGGLILGDYNHATRLVSELGEQGASTQYFFMAGLLASALASALFVAHLWRACRAVRAAVIPVVLLLTFTVSVAGAAIFPLPLRMHLYVGFPSVLLPLSPLLGLVVWRDVPGLSDTRPYAVAGFLVMALGYLSFIPGFLDGYPGLVQRAFHLGWTVWFVGLARCVRVGSAANRQG